MTKILAIKALNQYRKRDIIAYLGLRYYFQAKTGSDNRWISDVCTRLALSADESSYFRTYHFKGFNGAVPEHRDIYIPSPNEALAEVSLIVELSKDEAFDPKSYVYSYRFSKEKEMGGVFQAYFNGFRERHRHIASACKRNERGTVLFTDIKKFYPSILASDALSAWRRACGKSKLDEKYKELGEKILGRHSAISLRDGSGKGLLTGPLFSHVIANLLLDDVDAAMHGITDGNYWRYVDDVVMVGAHDDVTRWRGILEEKFKALLLNLHDGEKDFNLPCEVWLEGENDFEESFGTTWISLIGDVKKFLIANPEKSADLHNAFIEKHVRIPVIDYSNAVKASTQLQKFQDWLGKYKWAKRSVRKITINTLVSKAKICELELSEKLDGLLKEYNENSAYGKKRRIPKIRYLAGRLLYLMSREDLSGLFGKLKHDADLMLVAKVIDAVATRDMTNVVIMGSNATHIAAQLIRSDCRNILIDDALPRSPFVDLSIAIIEFNGIRHNFIKEKVEIRLLANGENIPMLMNSQSQFIKEFSCLHGTYPSSYEQILDSSFDRDEELALDVLNQLQNSSHC
jgi:hypothetical protein